MSDENAPTALLTRRPPPRGVAMAGVATAVFLVILDSAMVNLAGSAIRTGLGLSAAELTVVVDSYLVTFAGLLLLGGRIADVLGGRRVFLAGMGVYLAASAFCALATSGTLLIVGRVGQGLGAAAVMPAALSLVLALWPSPAERTRAMGIWGAVAGLGSLVGVFLGGTLTATLGWQSVFLAPVPFGIVGALVVWRSLPSAPGRTREAALSPGPAVPGRTARVHKPTASGRAGSSLEPGRFDVIGALTITVGVCALALGTVSASEAGWAAPGTLLGLGVGLTSLAAFVHAERRSAHPLVPLGVFRRKPVVTANLVVLLLGATLTGLFFFLPQYQQDVLGMSPLATGTAQLPIAGTIIVGSVAAPLLARRIGLTRALPVSLAVLLAGFLWLVLDPTASGFSLSLLGAFLLIGSGLGLGLVNATAMGVRDSAEGESGLLSGLINAAQQLGGAVGLAALAGIAIGASGTHGDISFSAAFLGEAALVLIALALSLVPAVRPHPATATTGTH
ncbi:MFS transporter [Streptomyces sp. NPDC004111]|uniref:MFS transporter n=1 Tax=Streptomyces sp. NPDC004111 TaxID=3364690 RepID=UPI003690C9A4